MSALTCTARDGMVFDRAGTGYTIDEALYRFGIVTDLAATDDHPEYMERRATDLCAAIIQAKRQSAALLAEVAS